MQNIESYLERLKKVEIELLKVFIDVCKTIDVKYYIIDGTLLGAVRHGGFIPWDDDIDIGMLRADYEKFIELAQEYMPEGIFVQSYKTDPGFPGNFVKIRNSNTTFIESAMKNCSMNHGVYIDVFPLDFCNKKKLKIFNIKKKFLSLCISNAFSLDDSKLKRRTRILKKVYKLVGPSIESAVVKREQLYKSAERGPYLANFMWGEKEIVPAEWFSKSVGLSFEGIIVNAPYKYDNYLRQVYGDYMTYPPEEERKPHHYVDIIDLDTTYLKYV